MPSGSLKYEGSAHFRARLSASTLSGRNLRLDAIRADAMTMANTKSTGAGQQEENGPTMGLQDFEACYLRLIDSLSDGCAIEVNETGTKLLYKPGILIGGKLTHDCGTSRSIGWFLEGVLPLLPFCKEPTRLTLTGITNDAVDISIDTIAHITIPLMKQFGVEGLSLTIKRRGAAPKGGGIVEIYCPVVRSLKPVYMINSGKVRRVRGVVYCSRISPTVITRVIDASKTVLRNVITDVFINSDPYKGVEAGLSAGYSVFLTAESTTGASLSIERGAAPSNTGGGELPESIGQQAALLLLEEICLGGVVDRTHQALALHMMALCSEDISKIRFGRELTDNAIAMLRILKDAYGVVFKIKRTTSSSIDSNTIVEDEPEEDEGSDEENMDEKGMAMNKDGREKKDISTTGMLSARKRTDESGTLELSCLGIGYINMSRRIK